MGENSEQESSFVEGGSRFIDQRRSNIKSDLIEITEDKLENILIKHLHRMNSLRSWITPLSLLVSVILAVATTATFSDFLGVSADVWEAGFLLVGAGCFFWFLYSLIIIIKNFKSSSIEFLIQRIKNAEGENI